MTLLDVSIVNVALPSIESSLNAGSQEIQWIVAGYTLTFGLTLVAAGRAGDIFGRRNLFMIGLAGFIAASAGAGLATDDTMLAVMRLIQGVFAGILNPQVLGMMQDMFRGAARAKAFGAFGVIVGVSTAIGPVLGGALVSLAPLDIGWRLVFLINLPIGLVVLPLAAKYLPNHAGQKDTGKNLFRMLDPVGIVLVAITVLAVMVTFLDSEGSGDSASDASRYWLLGVAALAALATYLWERWSYSRGGTVLLDPRLAHNPSFVLGVLTSFFYFAGFSSIFLTSTMYLQQGMGWSPWYAGLAAMPFAVISGFASGLSGRLVTVYGRNIPIAGALIVAISIAVLAASAQWVPLPAQPFAVILFMSIAGFGSGLLISPNQTLTLEDVPGEVAGIAAALLQTFQRLGAAIGLAVVSTIYFRTLSTVGSTEESGKAMAAASIVTAGIVFLAFVSSLADKLRRGHDARKGSGDREG